MTNACHHCGAVPTVTVLRVPGTGPVGLCRSCDRRFESGDLVLTLTTSEPFSKTATFTTIGRAP